MKFFMKQASEESDDSVTVRGKTPVSSLSTKEVRPGKFVVQGVIAAVAQDAAARFAAALNKRGADAPKADAKDALAKS